MKSQKYKVIGFNGFGRSLIKFVTAKTKEQARILFYKRTRGEPFRDIIRVERA